MPNVEVWTMKKTLLFFCILLLSCDKTGPTEYGFILTDVRFVAGTRYTYGWSMVTRDSAGNLLSEYYDTLVVIVEATGAQIDTLDGLTRVRGYSLVDSIGSTLVWYQNDQSACAEVAYRNAGAIPFVLPKKGTTREQWTVEPRSNPFFFPLIIQNVLPAPRMTPVDSLIVRNDPRIVFKYPLIIGGSWVSFTDPWLQTRQVVGSEFVQTPMGSRRCVKISSDSPMFGESIEWFDYVDENGLVLRAIKINFVMMTSEGDTVGTATGIERAELLSLE